MELPPWRWDMARPETRDIQVICKAFPQQPPAFANEMVSNTTSLGTTWRCPVGLGNRTWGTLRSPERGGWNFETATGFKFWRKTLDSNQLHASQRSPRILMEWNWQDWQLRQGLLGRESYIVLTLIWGVLEMGVPKNGWFTVQIPIVFVVFFGVRYPHF